MAQLKIGSKYGKPAKFVDSVVNQDNRIDERKVAEYDRTHPNAPFWGTKEKPAYYSGLWIPYLAAGNNTTKEEALKQIGDLIDNLEAARKADSLLVESNGDPDANGKPTVVKRYDGAVLGSMSVGDMKLRSVLAQAEDGMTAAAYICSCVKERLKLNHQQEPNGIMRKVAVQRATDLGLTKAKGAGAGRSRSDEVA